MPRWSSSTASTVATAVVVVGSTAAALRYVMTRREQRRRLGNFPFSYGWYLPFSLDLVRAIGAGSLEKFFERRRDALKSDAFYIHFPGGQRPTLALTDPKDFVELMKKEGKLNLAVDMPDTILDTHGAGSLQVISGKRHNHLRKIFASLLHPTAMESFAPYFFDAFTSMWRDLEEECRTNGGSTVVIQDAICKAQFFLMCKILYGMTPENTEVETLLQMRDDFEAQLEGHFAPPKSAKFQKAKEGSQRIRKILSEKFNAVLETRLKMTQQPGLDEGSDEEKVEEESVNPVGNAMESIADALIKDGTHADPQIVSDVYDNLNLLLEASHGTTMTVTTSALYYLNHPDNATKLEKLREEMTKFDSHLPNLNNLKNDMPFAEGVINETMRLAPIVGSIAYAVKEDIAFKFKGQQLKGPVSFMLALALANFNDELYPNPDAFVPERWMSGAAEEANDEAKAAFKPFGMGRHLCLGYRLAMLVMKSALYCFAKDGGEGDLVVEYDTEKCVRKAALFPAYSISGGLPGRVVRKMQ